MIIYLHCAPEVELDSESLLTAEAYPDWERAQRRRPSLKRLNFSDPGPGSPVLASSTQAAVDAASACFHERRIEVKPGYADPILKVPHLGVKLKARSWRRLAGLTYFLGWKAQEETPEALKQRMIALATRLIGLAKESGDAHYVGDPLLIRLLSLKLSSIGYQGPMFSKPRFGTSKRFEYASPKDRPALEIKDE